MASDYKDLLNEAFSAPAPKGKDAFLKNIRPREVSLFAMIWQQAAYIRVAVWLLAALVVGVAIAGAVLKLESAQNAVTMLMPFTAAVAVIESNRSRRCGMSELETATRFSLRSVVLARMTLLGAAALIVLLIAAPVISAVTCEGAVFTAVRMVIPYLLTMSISLPIERSSLGRKTDLSSLAVASVIVFVIYYVSNFGGAVFTSYLQIIGRWGVLIALGLLALTAAQQWKTINKSEELA